MTDKTVALVRQAILTVLDEANPRTPGLAWDFNDDEQRVDFADRVASFIPSAKGTFETPESPQGEEAQVAGQATNGASGDNPGRCGSVRTLADSKGSTCRQSESAAPDESNRHCQYAQDVGMPEYRCAVECQYMKSATASPTERDAKRYAARRWTIYHGRLRLQVGGPRQSFEDFVKEYDRECDKEVVKFEAERREYGPVDTTDSGVKP